MTAVIERYANWMWKNCPGKLDQLAPGATDDAIAAFEKRHDITFSEGLRELYRWRDGVHEGEFGGDHVGRYSLMSLEQVAKNQDMMRGLLAQGAFGQRKHWWHERWFPILDKGTGDFVCWDPDGSFASAGGTEGQMLEFWHTDPDRKILAPSFDAYFSAYVDSLEAHVWTYSEDDGLDDGFQFPGFLAKRFPGYPFNAIDMDGRKGRRSEAPTTVAAADRPVKLYAISTQYVAGDTLAHPQFGTGVVQSVEPTKAHVLFTSGMRTLIHARAPQASKLEKPQRIDHEPRTDKPKF